MAWLRRILVLLASLALASTARAEPPRIATLEQDPALAHAVGVALSSWRADLVPLQAARPGPDMTDATKEADAISRAAHADALFWIARGEGEASSSCSLWVYDPSTRSVTVRPLADCPPYDDATSAAVALTVKTVLRDVLAPTATPVSSQDTSPPSPPRHTVRLEGLLAGSIPTHAADPIAARFGLEATYFPAGLRGYAGVAASFDAGPSEDVSRPGVFTGTFSDVAARVTLRGRVPLRRWLWLEIGVGPGLHFTTLEGSSPAGDVSGSVSRVDPSLDVMTDLEFAWKWLRVGPLLGGSFLFGYQRYRVGQNLVLDVPVAQAQLGMRIGVELP